MRGGAAFGAALAGWLVLAAGPGAQGALAQETGGDAAPQDPSAPATARPAPDVGPGSLASPILTLDQDRLFEESVFGKAMRARLQAESEALASENRRIETALEQEERDLTARRPTLSAADFTPLAEAFDAKVEDIRKAQEAKSRDIARREVADRQTFIATVVPVLGELMSETGAVAIVDKSALVLALSAIDVTAAAIARVDRVLGQDGAPVAPTPETPAPETPAPQTPAPAP